MGPLFNPLYWLFGLIALVVAMCAAIIVGIIVYRVSFLLAQKNLKRRALRVGLPVALTVMATPVVFCLVMGSLCEWSLSGPPHPRRRPTREDIVGIWVPDASSLQRMEEEGGYKVSTHTLTFRDDGTFEMMNMPDWWLNFGESRGGFYSGSGTWKIAEEFDKWVIDVQFTSFSSYENGFGTSFYIGGRKPPHYIYDYIGDPDSYNLMMFERQ